MDRLGQKILRSLCRVEWIAAKFVHAAHRLRFTVEHGFQLRRHDAAIATVCYGGALVGIAAAGYLLFVAL